MTELPASDLRVAVGAHKLYDTGELGQKRHSVAQVVIHEQYVRTRNSHDIMLLRVIPPIQFNPKTVGPICVDGTEFEPGTECMVTGWGSVNPASTLTRSTHVQPCAFSKDIFFGFIKCKHFIFPSVYCQY